MNCIDFIFDGQKLSQYSSVVCSLTNSSTGAEVINIGSKLTFNTINNNTSNQFRLSWAQYDEPYQVTFQISKLNCEDVNDVVYTDLEISEMRRWLMRKEYKEFKPIYEDGELSSVFYVGSFTEVQPITLGEDVMGFECTFMSDSACGYHEDKRNAFELNAGESFSIYDTSDMVGFIYPKITIAVHEDIDMFELQNENTGKITQIANLEENEVIVIDCKNKIITSSKTHKGLANDFNYIFPKLYNDIRNERNVFTVSDACTITFRYRPTANVGMIY